MTRTRLRLCLLCEDLSLPIEEGIKKFVTSVSGPLAQMADLLVLAAGDAGPLPASVQAAPANRFLLSRTLGRTLRHFQPDIVVYVPIAAATRNSFVRCAILRGYAPRARLLMVSLQPRTCLWSPPPPPLRPRPRPPSSGPSPPPGGGETAGEPPTSGRGGAARPQ